MVPTVRYSIPEKLNASPHTLKSDRSCGVIFTLIVNSFDHTN